MITIRNLINSREYPYPNNCHEFITAIIYQQQGDILISLWIFQSWQNPVPAKRLFVFSTNWGVVRGAAMPLCGSPLTWDCGFSGHVPKKPLLARAERVSVRANVSGVCRLYRSKSALAIRLSPGNYTWAKANPQAKAVEDRFRLEAWRLFRHAQTPDDSQASQNVEKL